jgi:hypothetical protein
VRVIYKQTKKNKMELTKSQLITLQQALGYAVIYAKTEHETAEFALLKLDVDSAIISLKTLEKHKAEHEKMGCPFKYCDSNPKCEGKCRYAN